MIVMLIFVGLFIVACSNDEDGDAKAGKEISEDSVELVMYSWRPEDRDMYEKAFEAFNEQHPHITVDFQPYKSTEYNTILTNALVSGSGPDIIQLRPYSGAKSIADNDYILPLDDLEGIDNIQDQYLDAAKGSDGKVYGVPLTLNSGVIFYNKELFEEYGIEVPVTWDDFVEAGKILKENGIVPIAQAGREAYLLSMLHGVLSPAAYGSDFADKVVNGEASFSDPEFAESVERMKQIADFFPKDFIAIEDDSAQTMFFTGEAAMYINGDYRLATFESTAPDMAIGVIPGLAESEGTDPLVTTWVDGSYAAVKNTEHEEEARLFLEFLASPEFGQIFTDEVNRLSAVDGVQPSHEIVKQISEAAELNPTPYLMLVHYGTGEPTTKTTFENALQGLYMDAIDIDGLIEETQANADRAEAQ